MTVNRTASRPGFDTCLDLRPAGAGQLPTHAYVLVKTTLAIRGSGCARVGPVPLAHDLRDHPDTLPIGSDFWTQKEKTDVIVLGAAFAARGRPVERMDVCCAVGAHSKRVAVFGDRVVEWSRGGRACISAPEPFTEMPLVNERAYGGADLRVPVPDVETLVDLVRLASDHPGVYPRNPFGRGYVVVDDPVDGIALPNLEDPDDLLTDERVLVRDPALWWRQPLSWSLDWSHPLMFHRYVHCGADAWHPAKDEDLEEVRRGLLPRNARTSADDVLPSMFYQEASLGMALNGSAPGTPICVTGMHPDGADFELQLPPTPRVTFDLDGTSVPSEARLTTLLLQPAERTACLTYVAEAKLPRPYVPGIHRDIPIAATIDGDEPIVYEAPASLHDRLEAGAFRRGHHP